MYGAHLCGTVLWGLAPGKKREVWTLLGGKALTRASVSNAEISITRVYFEAELENRLHWCFFLFALALNQFSLTLILFPLICEFLYLWSLLYFFSYDVYILSTLSDWLTQMWRALLMLILFAFYLTKSRTLTPCLLFSHAPGLVLVCPHLRYLASLFFDSTASLSRIHHSHLTRQLYL